VHRNDLRTFYIAGSQFSVIARVQMGGFLVVFGVKEMCALAGLHGA
jgi:hypothetical protein